MLTSIDIDWTLDDVNKVMAGEFDDMHDYIPAEGNDNVFNEATGPFFTSTCVCVTKSHRVFVM